MQSVKCSKWNRDKRWKQQWCLTAQLCKWVPVTATIPKAHKSNFTHGVLHMETCFSLQDEAVVHSVWWGWKEIFLLLFLVVVAYVSTICISMLGVDYEACLSHYEHICRGQMVAFGQLKAAWNSQHRQVSIRNAQMLPLCRKTIFKRGRYTSKGAEKNDKVGAILRCLLSSVWYLSPWLSPC